MRHTLFALLVVLGSCDRASSPMAPASEAISGGFILPPDSGALTPAAERKVVRTGELQFRVTDLANARATLLDSATAHGGYVAGDASDELPHALRSVLRLRIPAGRLDPFLVAIEQIGALELRRLDAADVSEQWVDLEARLTAKARIEQRYLEVIARAADVTEVLAVEGERGKVRADVESMQARMRVLGDQVAMSTLIVTCLQPRSQPGTLAFGAALRGGWDALLRVLVGITFAWPLLVLASLAVIVCWLRRTPRPQAPPLPVNG